MGGGECANTQLIPEGIKPTKQGNAKGNHLAQRNASSPH